MPRPNMRKGPYNPKSPPSPFLSMSRVYRQILSQHYGPEVQKVVDTVDDDCFVCRAAAARSPPR